MSKASKFAKVLKLIATFTAHGLRVAVTLIVSLLKELFKGLHKRLKFSITFKTAIIYTLIFSTILFLMSIVLVSSFGAFLLYENKKSLERSAKVTMNLISESTGIPEAGLKKYADIEGITITLFNKQREITYTTGAVNKNNDLDREIHRFSEISLTSEYIHLNTQPKLNEDVYYIQLSKPLIRGKLYLAILVTAISIGFIPAVLLTVFIGSRILKKMLKPIDNMISTAKAISARDLDTRLNVVNSHDELKELAETFNQMLDRIQTSYEQQNQFVSDASHELRTPISVIQGYANLLQRWGKEDKAVLDESISAIKNEADNMKELVERLLFLARADQNTQKTEKSLFPVNELVDEVLKETRLIDTEHKITGDIIGTIVINADRGLIKQALRILIDNSIKYTPPGGTIKIDGCSKDNKVILTIADNGLGISSQDLPYIFNRFYKCDKSRTREGGGSGLGLSIAKWVVEKHKGTIAVESALNKGTKVIIYLPV